MLDIDLEFLKFLVNPSYEYLADDIKVIQKAYLEMAEGEDKTKKEEYFKGVNYLFLQTPEELCYFIGEFYYEIIYDVYSRLFKLFSFNMDNEIIEKNNNFIDGIFLSKGLKDYTDDIDLSILRNEIRKYLVDVIQSNDNKKDVELAKKAISEIDIMLEKFDRVNNILDSRLKEVFTILNKKIKIRDKFRRDFILEYQYLLSDNGKKFIRENNYYDVDSFLNGEELFCKYFVRNCEEVFLVNDLIDADNLDKRREDVDYYNEMYMECVEEYKYMESTSALIDKVDSLIDKSLLKKGFYVDERVNEEFMCEMCEKALSDGNWNGQYMVFGIDYGSGNIPVKFLQFFNLRTFEFINHKLVCNLYNCLAHELGHNFDFGFSGYYLSDDNNEGLYEMYNEYRSIKLIDKLINEGNFCKKGVIHNSKPNCPYYDKMFLLIDLFEEHRDYFKRYVVEDSETSLRELLGDNNFEEVLKYLRKLEYPNDDLIKDGILFREEMNKEIKKRLKVK